MPQRKADDAPRGEMLPAAAFRYDGVSLVASSAFSDGFLVIADPSAVIAGFLCHCGLDPQSVPFSSLRAMTRNLFGMPDQVRHDGEEGQDGEKGMTGSGSESSMTAA